MCSSKTKEQLTFRAIVLRVDGEVAPPIQFRLRSQMRALAPLKGRGDGGLWARPPDAYRVPVENCDAETTQCAKGKAQAAAPNVNIRDRSGAAHGLLCNTTVALAVSFLVADKRGWRLARVEALSAGPRTGWTRVWITQDVRHPKPLRSFSSRRVSIRTATRSCLGLRTEHLSSIRTSHKH